MKSITALGCLSILAIVTTASSAQQSQYAPLPVESEQAAGSSNYFDATSGGACDYCTGGSAFGGCDDGTCGRPRLFANGIRRPSLLPSDSCFDCFISPITNPFYFEDPRALTEIVPIYIHHELPGQDETVLDAYVVQLRARLSENVSFIGVKNGYYNFSEGQEGWADLGFGLKFTLLRDPAAQKIWSAGFTLETPSGSNDVSQGIGDGNLNLFLSSARRLGSRFYHMSSSGIRLPFDGDEGSTSTWVSQHLSTPITDKVYALTELNWYRWVSSGTNATTPGIEGVDLINFGSTDVTGSNVVTWAYGAKVKPNRNNELGAAYEIPLSGNRDIFGSRLTAHWIFRY